MINNSVHAVIFYGHIQILHDLHKKGSVMVSFK